MLRVPEPEIGPTPQTTSKKSFPCVCFLVFNNVSCLLYYKHPRIVLQLLLICTIYDLPKYPFLHRELIHTNPNKLPPLNWDIPNSFSHDILLVYCPDRNELISLWL